MKEIKCAILQSSKYCMEGTLKDIKNIQTRLEGISLLKYEGKHKDINDLTSTGT